MSTKINDIIEPAVFSAYVREKIAEKSALIASGAVVNSEKLDQLASGGGRTVSMPFWKRISGDSEVLSDSGSLTADAVPANADVAAINYRGKAWSARELASAVAGDSAVAAVADMVADYWVREEQKLLVATLAGVFASVGMAGHVHGSATTPVALTASMVLDAKQLLGDAFGQLHTIIMHSAAFTSLQKQDLISTFRPSESGSLMNNYMGFNVIVDDSVQYDEAKGVYSTYLLADGVIGRGDGSPVDFTTVETYRDGLKGEDYMIYRKALILHPFGVQFTSTNVSGISPTNNELSGANNWKRVYDSKNIGMVEIKHTIQ